MLGLNDKRVKQVLNVPVADESSADLFSHSWDVVHFIGRCACAQNVAVNVLATTTL